GDAADQLGVPIQLLARRASEVFFQSSLARRATQGGIMAVRGNTFCGSPEHAIDRRGFLGGLAAGAAGLAGLDVLTEPAVAAQMKKQQKRCILLWLAGGASQLETWDPKPGVETGGPFGAIPTCVPGVHISELMPRMARRLKDTCIIRSLNTRNGDHSGASRMMMRGRAGESNL